MAEAYRRQRIRTALQRAGHLVLGQPAGPFAGGGRSDLIVCVRPFGLFGAVECKEKGEKPTRAQRAFGASVERAGGFWIVGYTPEEVLRDLERAITTILRRQSMTTPGADMSIDIDDLFTNPPPPLKPEELAELVDETEPAGTSVPISNDVTVTEVTINGTTVAPGLPEAAAKVMGYESAAARDRVDPPPTKRRPSRAKKKGPVLIVEPAREDKIAELDARDEALDGTGVLDAIEEIGESTPFDEIRVLRGEYEKVLAELGDAVSALNVAVQHLLQLEVRAV